MAPMPRTRLHSTACSLDDCGNQAIALKNPSMSVMAMLRQLGNAIRFEGTVVLKRKFSRSTNPHTALPATDGAFTSQAAQGVILKIVPLR